MPNSELANLLASLDPWLDPRAWQFVRRKTPPPDALMTFREDEGTTAIVEAPVAGPDTFRWIVLRVPSSLHAVGLTAAVSSCLAERGIAANVVAALHHDHIFVPAKDAERGHEALVELARLTARPEPNVAGAVVTAPSA